MRVFTYLIDTFYNNIPVYDVLKAEGYSHRIIVRLKKDTSSITLNGKHIRMIDKVKNGDVLVIRLFEDSFISENSSIYVPVIYEDEDFIVYNKPANMPTHPSRCHQNDTLANVYMSYIKATGMQSTFRPINRLDRDTCGLCVIAKNALVTSINTTLDKEYQAILCGKLQMNSGTIDANIARENDFYIKRTISSTGQRAITHYITIDKNEKYTLVKIKLDTGRTHQIRVHFAYLGYPLAGDSMYGGNTVDFSTQALLCNKVSFFHPIKKCQISLELPSLQLPQDT